MKTIRENQPKRDTSKRKTLPVAEPRLARNTTFVEYARGQVNLTREYQRGRDNRFVDVNDFA